MWNSPSSIGLSRENPSTLATAASTSALRVYVPLSDLNRSPPFFGVSFAALSSQRRKVVILTHTFVVVINAQHNLDHHSELRLLFHKEDSSTDNLFFNSVAMDGKIVELWLDTCALMMASAQIMNLSCNKPGCAWLSLVSKDLPFICSVVFVQDGIPFLETPNRLDVIAEHKNRVHRHTGHHAHKHSEKLVHETLPRICQEKRAGQAAAEGLLQLEVLPVLVNAKTNEGCRRESGTTMSSTGPWRS